MIPEHYRTAIIDVMNESDKVLMIMEKYYEGGDDNKRISTSEFLIQ